MAADMNELKSMFERMTVEIANFTVRQTQIKNQNEKAFAELKESIDEVRRFDRGKSIEVLDSGGETYTPSGNPAAWVPNTTGRNTMPHYSPTGYPFGVNSVPQYPATLEKFPQLTPINGEQQTEQTPAAPTSGGLQTVHQTGQTSTGAQRTVVNTGSNHRAVQNKGGLTFSRMTKMESPRFNGTNLRAWLCKALTCHELLHGLVRRKNVCVHLVELESWHELANSFANEQTLFSLNAAHQRSLAQTLVLSASGMKTPEASGQYVRNLTNHMTANLVELSSRSNLKCVAEQPDIILLVSCLLERLRGAASATEPRTQRAIYEMGYAALNPLLMFMEAYKHESTVVYLLLRFVVDWVDVQINYLEARETAIVVGFCMSLLQLYSSHNIGKISLSISSSLRSEADTERYKDLRAVLQLLASLCSKDLVDFSSEPINAQGTNICQVVYMGLHIVTPLISLDLLKYPKLCLDYFSLLSHMLEVYPEIITQLNGEAFVHIIKTLDFGLSQNAEVVDLCLRAIKGLASFHYKQKSSGEVGLGHHASGYKDHTGNFQEGILSQFLRSLLQFLLFQDYSTDLVGSAADALLPLILCEQSLYQKLGSELIESQSDPAFRSRLTNALQSLTSSNSLSSTLDRPNYQKFRKNLHNFLTEVRGFLRKI